MAAAKRQRDETARLLASMESMAVEELGFNDGTTPPRREWKLRRRVDHPAAWSPPAGALQLHGANDDFSPLLLSTPPSSSDSESPLTSREETDIGKVMTLEAQLYPINYRLKDLHANVLDVIHNRTEKARLLNQGMSYADLRKLMRDRVFNIISGLPAVLADFHEVLGPPTWKATDMEGHSSQQEI